jgi:hypothetical protein
MRKEDFFDPSSFSYKKRLEIGDKVRFLNSVGGGRVTAFHGKDQVLVEDENGFDVPVLIAECVRIGDSDSRLEAREPELYIPPAKTPVPQSPPKKSPPSILQTSALDPPEGERLNLSLAFLPVDPKQFIQTAFESYFVNESNYYMYANLMSCKNNAWTSRFHGLIEPDTKIFIEEFGKQDLGDLEHICVQLLAFKEGKTYSFKKTFSVELRPDTVKFYKLHCFTTNPFFDEDALVIPLITNDVPERQMLVSATEIQDAIYDNKREPTKNRTERVKIKTPAILEIDLHINQLIDSTSGMNNADILNYQMSKFHETIKANLGKKGQKIVFIHGKGEGVLRTAIEKELKTTYKQQCSFQDASFREYGYGATMVTIR